MRNPEKVLNTLCLHSKVSDYKYERLYRILFNEDMFYVAYQRIYAKQGNIRRRWQNNRPNEHSENRTYY